MNDTPEHNNRTEKLVDHLDVIPRIICSEAFV